MYYILHDKCVPAEEVLGFCSASNQFLSRLASKVCDRSSDNGCLSSSNLHSSEFP